MTHKHTPSRFAIVAVLATVAIPATPLFAQETVAPPVIMAAPAPAPVAAAPAPAAAPVIAPAQEVVQPVITPPTVARTVTPPARKAAPRAVVAERTEARTAAPSTVTQRAPVAQAPVAPVEATPAPIIPAPVVERAPAAAAPVATANAPVPVGGETPIALLIALGLAGLAAVGGVFAFRRRSTTEDRAVVASPAHEMVAVAPAPTMAREFADAPAAKRTSRTKAAHPVVTKGAHTVASPIAKSEREKMRLAREAKPAFTRQPSGSQRSSDYRGSAGLATA